MINFKRISEFNKKIQTHSDIARHHLTTYLFLCMLDKFIILRRAMAIYLPIQLCVRSHCVLYAQIHTQTHFKKKTCCLVHIKICWPYAENMQICITLSQPHELVPRTPEALVNIRSYCDCLFGYFAALSNSNFL